MKEINNLKINVLYYTFNEEKTFFPKLAGNKTEYQIKEKLIEHLIDDVENFEFLKYKNQIYLEEKNFILFKIYLYILENENKFNGLPFPIYINKIIHKENYTNYTRIMNGEKTFDETVESYVWNNIIDFNDFYFDEFGIDFNKKSSKKWKKEKGINDD